MAPATADGVLLVDKPAGMTSHDVVGVARRALRERRIGHAGTLDPFATGLLVLAIRRATRLLPYVSGEPKVYDATIRFGTETSTDDLTGDVVSDAALPSGDAVADAIRTLTGTIDQVPPAYSAKQVGGVRAYAAARAGTALALAPVPVVVHEWAIREARTSELDVTITCGGGTYIRALARDLGRRAGSAAHLTRLRRLRSGRFDVASAVTLDSLRQGDVSIMPPVEAVPELPVRPLSDDEVARVAHGKRVASGGTAGAAIALVDGRGSLVGIAASIGDELQPRMVLHGG